MSEQFKFRLYCCTESNYVDFWSYDDPPTTCPNSYKHTIDKTKMYKLDERYVGRKNVVYIQEEDTATQGRYRFECIKYHIDSNASQYHDYVFPYPINMLEVKIRSAETHRGDIMNCQVIPAPPIGYLTAPVAAGSSNFVVNNTVLSYMNIGFHMSLMSGSNLLEDLEEVLVKNDSNNTVTTQFAVSNSYPPGTHVHMHISFIKNLEFTEPDWYTIGDRKIGASYLPAKTTLRMTYSNQNLQDKDVILYTQYLY